MEVPQAANVQVGSASASGNAFQVIGNLDIKNYHGLSSEDAVDRDWLKVAQFLSPPDGAVQLQQNLHNEARSNQQSGTGRWFVDGASFQSWLDGREPLIWFHGFVGCGKTVLFSSAVEKIRSQSLSATGRAEGKQQSFGYFYCTSRVSSGQSITNILRLLIAQLCQRRKKVPQPVQDLFDECNRNFPFRVPTVQELATTLLRLVSPSTSEVDETQRGEPMSSHSTDDEYYFLLDGLDELDWSVRDSFFGMINPILQLGARNVRFLVTSRHPSDVPASACAQTGHGPVWKMIEIDMQQVQMDIEAFVADEIKSHSRLQALEPDTKFKIMQKIGVAAEGMFRWAYLQMQELKRLHLPITTLKVLRQLNNLPRDLDTTYARRFRDIDPLDKPMVYKALIWVSFSSRPLFLQEIIDACAFELVQMEGPGSLERLSHSDFCELTRDLISVQPAVLPDDEEDSVSNRTAILTHASIGDFLRRLGTGETAHTHPGLEFFAIKETEGNHVLAQVCLAYLFSYNNFRLRHEKYPLRRYAWYNWEKHIQVNSRDAPVSQEIVTSAMFRRKAIRIFQAFKRANGDACGDSEPDSDGLDHSREHEDLDALQSILEELPVTSTPGFRTDQQAVQALADAINIPFFHDRFDEFWPSFASDTTAPTTRNNAEDAASAAATTTTSRPGEAPIRWVARTDTQLSILSTDSYSYAALSSSATAIRLVEILPSLDPQAKIRCRLFEADLANPPPYAALSYVGGQSESAEEIEVDGNRISVSPIQRQLLQMLRYRTENSHPAFWFDVLCVNRADADEWSKQAQLVPSIFSKAQEVLVGLGGPTANEDSSVRALAAVAAASASLMDPGAQPAARALSANALHEIGRGGGWQDIMRIFRTVWWTRRWVVQEIIHASMPVLLFGTLAFNFSVVEQIVAAEPLIKDIVRSFPLESQPGWRSAKRMVRARREFALNRGLELPSLLWNFRHNVCMLPKDMVFAFLGLCRHTTANAIWPEFPKAADDVTVFTQTSFWVLKTYETLDLLSIRSAYFPSADETLPTWVLPLAARVSERKPLSLGIFDGTESFATYRACGNATKPFLRLSAEGQITLHGCIIDIIEEIVEGADESAAANLPARLSTLCQAVRTRQVSLNKDAQESVEARWRTILADQWPLGRRLGSLQLAEAVPLPPTTPEEEETLLQLYYRGTIRNTDISLEHFLHARQVVVTSERRLGLTPVEAQSGDSIVLMPGGAVPYVLRRTGSRWQFIGECYVHDCMDGGLGDSTLPDHWWKDEFEIA